MNSQRLLSVVTASVAVAGLALATPAPAKAADGTIVLGTAISFTGKYSTNGIHTKNGYDLGIKKVNEMGGVKVGGKHYKLKIQYYDDESTPLRTGQLLERLVKQDGVKFFLGPYSSATTKAAAPIMEKYKLPMIEAEGASRSLFNKGYKYLFAVLATSEQYLAPALGLAKMEAEKQGKKMSDVKVALVFENDPFSLDVRAGLVDLAKKYGMHVVIDDKMPRDLNDISSTLTKVKALKPDVLLASGHSKGAATLARQVKEMKINVPMIAVTHCEAAKIVEKFGAATNGFLCPTQWAETLKYKGKYFGSAGDYNKLFLQTYSSYHTVPYQAAQATAAILVFKDAIERANSLDPQKVRDALAKTDLQTFYGEVKFSPEGKNVKKEMVLRQIQNGHYNVVAPPAFAAAKLEWPRKAM